MRVKDALAAVLQRLDKLETVQAAPKAQKKEKPKTVQAEEAEEPKPKRPGGAINRANTIFLAVQDWNRQHPEQTLAITLSLLKDEFGINFKAARSFLEKRQNDIGELHQASGVENPRSHNRQQGQDLEQLKRFVRGQS